MIPYNFGVCESCHVYPVQHQNGRLDIYVDKQQVEILEKLRGDQLILQVFSDNGILKLKGKGSTPSLTNILFNDITGKYKRINGSTHDYRPWNFECFGIKKKIEIKRTYDNGEGYWILMDYHKYLLEKLENIMTKTPSQKLHIKNTAITDPIITTSNDHIEFHNFEQRKHLYTRVKEIVGWYLRKMEPVGESTLESFKKEIKYSLFLVNEDVKLFIQEVIDKLELVNKIQDKLEYLSLYNQLPLLKAERKNIEDWFRVNFNPIRSVETGLYKPTTLDKKFSKYLCFNL